ncbi:zinc finger protein GAI-ASSOCIATED FACTOR 1-like [Aristolochia californica]|uniref:zinc finger protein GAI-ASSOCIATED FACTOR 1-like n=1 Tax=Aristolochia californica TaxID=171875 RepID=UPI0035D59541
MPAELPELGNSPPMAVSNATSASGEASVSSSGQQVAPAPAPAKKKRNLPGMPDPDAEVIALSPKTLMATNRFVCEICNKGFQRDQNLQLHRRGHNLPWKLRQRSSKEIRKRVYVCPEPSCVHHDPSRALGDLTGIKKHFCRKHGEKKWKCEKCSKKYAVQSDWKAHSKTCGTREYRCDCGTLFSRRDSFITHRAFCDALAEESARTHTAGNSASEEDPKLQIAATPASSSPPLTGVLPVQQREPENQILAPVPPPPVTTTIVGSSANASSSNGSSSNGSSSSSVFASLFASTTSTLQPQNSAFSDLLGAMTRADRPPTSQAMAPEPTSLCLSSNASHLFSPAPQERRPFAVPPLAHMSATALLQKAAQMGATASNGSLLRGFGLSPSSAAAASSTQRENLNSLWQSHDMVGPAGLDLGLEYDNVGLPELMAGQSSLFGPKPTTLDFLGLGVGGGVGQPGGLSALMTSIGGGLDVSSSFAGGNSPGKS